MDLPFAVFDVDHSELGSRIPGPSTEAIDQDAIGQTATKIRDYDNHQRRGLTYGGPSCTTAAAWWYQSARVMTVSSVASILASHDSTNSVYRTHHCRRRIDTRGDRRGRTPPGAHEGHHSTGWRDDYGTRKYLHGLSESRPHAPFGTVVFAYLPDSACGSHTGRNGPS